MSNPNIPNITPTISLSTAQTVPLLLSSIALEELALAHIMNAEAEKLQFVLGTLPPTRTAFSPATVTLSNLLAVDASVQRTLRDIIKKEMLLEFKFENVLDLIPTIPIPPSCPSTLTFPNGATVQFLGLTNNDLTWNYRLTVPTPPTVYGLFLLFPCSIDEVSCTNSAGICGKGCITNACGNPACQPDIFFFNASPTGQTTFNFSFTLNQRLPIGTIRAQLALSEFAQCFDICGPLCPSSGPLAQTNTETGEYILIGDNIRQFVIEEQ